MVTPRTSLFSLSSPIKSLVIYETSMSYNLAVIQEDLGSRYRFAVSNLSVHDFLQFFQVMIASWRIVLDYLFIYIVHNLIRSCLKSAVDIE